MNMAWIGVVLGGSEQQSSAHLNIGECVVERDGDVQYNRRVGKIRKVADGHDAKLRSAVEIF
jgi:hypothetical protein